MMKKDLLWLGKEEAWKNRESKGSCTKRNRKKREKDSTGNSDR